MDNVPIAGCNDVSQLVNRFLACYDAPAYVRRARAVQDAFDALIARCRRQRDEWLTMVRIEVGVLRRLAGEWANLLPYVADADQLRVLEELHDSLEPRLRVPVAATTSPRKLRRALATLRYGVERFNRRWKEYLEGLDLREINELREGYNRYYPVEKECAVRSPRLARQGYRPLSPLTPVDVAAVLPLLDLPRLR